MTMNIGSNISFEREGNGTILQQQEITKHSTQPIFYSWKFRWGARA